MFKMEEILKKGEVSQIVLEGGGALTGEVHLIKYEGKKYILRKCLTLKRTKFYEEIAQRLEKYGFLPKLIKRIGKKVIYEYIDGRHLRKNESMKVFEEIGRIVARLNKIKADKMENRFNKNLKNLLKGRFNPGIKILMRRKRSNIKRMPKKLISKGKYNLIKKIHRDLIKKTNTKITWDTSDITVTNFVMKKRKVYFVDVDSINSSLKGYGIAKFFNTWAKTVQRQNAFRKGYESILSLNYLDEDYKKLINLEFLIQRLNWHNHVGKDYRKDLKKLNSLKELK